MLIISKYVWIFVIVKLKKNSLDCIFLFKLHIYTSSNLIQDLLISDIKSLSLPALTVRVAVLVALPI